MATNEELEARVVELETNIKTIIKILEEAASVATNLDNKCEHIGLAVFATQMSIESVAEDLIRHTDGDEKADSFRKTADAIRNLAMSMNSDKEKPVPEEATHD